MIQIDSSEKYRMGAPGARHPFKTPPSKNYGRVHQIMDPCSPRNNQVAPETEYWLSYRVQSSIEVYLRQF